MDNTINQRVKNIVDHLNITQNAFASKIDVAGSVIYNIVNGRNKPSYDILERIVTVFDINPNYLFSGKGKIVSSNNETVSMEKGSDASYEIFFKQWSKIQQFVEANGKSEETKVYSFIASKFSIMSGILEHYSLLTQSSSFINIMPKNMDKKEFANQISSMLATEKEILKIIADYKDVIFELYDKLSDFNEKHDNIYHMDDDFIENIISEIGNK